MHPIYHSPIRLGIVGTGAIAHTHALAIAGVPDAKLVAVCGRTLEKARALADLHDAQAFDSLDHLAQSRDLDAVLIATASGAHAEGALPFLQNGKHVLCEKPLEVTTAGVRAMIDAARASGVILAGFFPLRQGAAAQHIKNALLQNRFGRLTFLSARVKWWRDQAYYQSSNWRGRWRWDGGGALMNQGIHAVDLLQWFGGPVAEVSAYAATLAHPGIEVEDTLCAGLRFDNGALGTIAAGTSCYPGLDLRLEICGYRGTAAMETDRLTTWKFADDQPGDDEIRAGRAAGQVGGGASDPKAISSEGHRRQIASFCQALRGEQADLIEGEEAGRAVAIVETVYRAACSGRSEKV